jgi:hypothetical protein
MVAATGISELPSSGGRFRIDGKEHAATRAACRLAAQQCCRDRGAGAVGGAIVGGSAGAAVGAAVGAVAGGIADESRPRFRTYVADSGIAPTGMTARSVSAPIRHPVA